MFLVLPEHSWSHISRTSILGVGANGNVFWRGSMDLRFNIEELGAQYGLILKALKSDWGPLR